MQFRKKPVVIDAVQWNGVSFSAEFPSWIRDGISLPAPDLVPGKIFRIGDNLHIATLEGEMTASPGDWIIRGIKGEIYPCKPDIFEATYEPA